MNGNSLRVGVGWRRVYSRNKLPHTHGLWRSFGEGEQNQMYLSLDASKISEQSFEKHGAILLVLLRCPNKDLRKNLTQETAGQIRAAVAKAG